jgi:hypothetical protein
MQPDVNVTRHAGWRPPPRHLDLPDGVVDVWRAEVADRDEARAVLTRLLAAYLKIEPAAVSFEVGPHGKPALAGAGATDLRFNMSHTRGLAVYAFARGTEVGIDVERARDRLDTVRMARRFIGADAADRLQALEPGERPQGFVTAWVRYEATVKCLGTGIAGRDLPKPAGDAPPWVAELDPGLGAAAAAVAVSAGPRRLRLWQWAGGHEQSSGHEESEP